MIKPSKNTLNIITELIGNFNIIKKLNDEPGYNVLLCEVINTGVMYIIEDREQFFVDHSDVVKDISEKSEGKLTVDQVHVRWRNLRLDIFNKFNEMSDRLPKLKHLTDSILIYETRLTSQWREMTEGDTTHSMNTLASLLNVNHPTGVIHNNTLIQSIEDWVSDTSGYVFKTEADSANPTLQDMITPLSVGDFYINGSDWMIVNPDKIEARMLPRLSRENSILTF